MPRPPSRAVWCMAALILLGARLSGQTCTLYDFKLPSSVPVTSLPLAGELLAWSGGSERECEELRAKIEATVRQRADQATQNRRKAFERESQAVTAEIHSIGKRLEDYQKASRELGDARAATRKAEEAEEAAFKARQEFPSACECVQSGRAKTDSSSPAGGVRDRSSSDRGRDVRRTPGSSSPQRRLPAGQRLDVAIQTALGHLATCDADNRMTPCNEFFCKAIDAAYPSPLNADFRRPNGGCLLANDIHEALLGLAQGTKRSTAGPLGAWTLIGSAASEDVLERAQACANEGVLTVASSAGINHGHLAIIVPGQLQPSSTWGASIPMVAGELMNSVGQRAEAGNGTSVPISRHWRPVERHSVRVFVQGVHQRAVRSNKCD